MCITSSTQKIALCASLYPTESATRPKIRKHIGVSNNCSEIGTGVPDTRKLDEVVLGHGGSKVAQFPENSTYSVGLISGVIRPFKRKMVVSN